MFGVWGVGVWRLQAWSECADLCEVPWHEICCWLADLWAFLKKCLSPNHLATEPSRPGFLHF